MSGLELNAMAGAETSKLAENIKSVKTFINLLEIKGLFCPHSRFYYVRPETCIRIIFHFYLRIFRRLLGTVPSALIYSRTSKIGTEGTVPISRSQLQPSVMKARRCALIFSSLLIVALARVAVAKPRLHQVGGVTFTAPDAISAGVKISWSRVPNASRYRFELFDGAGTPILSETIKGHSAIISGAQVNEGTRYKIRLQALATSHFLASPTIRKSFKYTTKFTTGEFYGSLKSTNLSGRRGTVFLPKNYRKRTLPAMVLFHGSAGNGKIIADVFKNSAHSRSFIIVAPDSIDEAGWEISESLSQPTDDERHIEDCIQELLSMPHVSISSLIVAGMSAGAPVAALYGSNDSRFESFAVFHGAINLETLGSNHVPVWLSTGSSDTLVTPQREQGYQSSLTALGFPEVVYSEYDIGHGIATKERKAFVAWWLR